MQEFEINLLIDERAQEITRLDGIKSKLVASGLNKNSEEFARQLRMNCDSPCPIFGLCERIEVAKKRFASTRSGGEPV